VPLTNPSSHLAPELPFSVPTSPPSLLAATGAPLPTQLNGVSVSIGGKTVPLSFVSASQINALIQFDAATLTASQTASLPVIVTATTGASAPFNVTLQRNAPAIYSKDFSGGGAALAFDANFNPISTIDGSAIILYATGIGPTDPPGNTNALAYADGVLNPTVDAISVSVGGTPADVLFSGLAPGLQGIYQLNILPKGLYASSTLLVTAGNSSAPILTLPVPVGVNVKNVSAGIPALYPSTDSKLPPTLLECLRTANGRPV
jgi:uncharacterized protein (TIGR03437 family)